MNRDEIIRMAREAGFVTGTRDYADGQGGMPFVQSVATGTILNELERFASLVAEAERSACLSECEEQASKSMIAAERATRIRAKESYQSAAIGAKFCVARISARGQA